jgi:hypothetical protein
MVGSGEYKNDNEYESRECEYECRVRFVPATIGSRAFDARVERGAKIEGGKMVFCKTSFRPTVLP